MVFNLLKRPHNSSIMDRVNCTPNKVALVERNFAPQGINFIDSKHVIKNTPNDLIEMAKEIEKADQFIKANTCSKLQVIAEQMQFLHKQAERILLEAKENVSLHHVACNFVKHPGNIYHLYQRISGQLYFSILSPQEWGELSPKQIHKGSFRLEHDQSWTPVSEIHLKDKDLSIIDKVYNSSNSSTKVPLSEYMSVDYS